MSGIARVTSLVLTFVLLLAACRIPLDEEARAIQGDEVEFNLLDEGPSTTSTTVPERPRFSIRLFWHNAVDNRLVIVQKGRETAPEPDEALLELVAGPTEADREINENLQTVLDQSMEPEVVGVIEGVYRIRINRQSEELLSTLQAAEFVCTLTQFVGIEQVEIVDPEDNLFSLSGVGAVALNGPARAADFGDCQEEPLPEDTTTTDPAAASTTQGG